jgi:uncharacterized protein YcbX
MTDAMTLQAIYRYPIKGMTPEPLAAVDLEAGNTLPFDRAFAIENGPGRFDQDNPRHLPKITFLMLMRDERLASLTSRFDDATQVLTIMRDGKQVARGDLSTPLGRKMIEQFIAAYMKAELRGAPRVVSAPGHSFSDVAVKCVHIVNLASVRDLQRVLGRPVDPLRFRANLYIDGLPAWEELKWLDREITIGDARLSIFARTQRCEATNVDPVTARRDMAIPATLSRTLGHTDFGIYAKVTAPGRIAVGNAVRSS